LRRFDTLQQCEGRTDRRKDASAVAKTRLVLHAVARKNVAKAKRWKVRVYTTGTHEANAIWRHQR